MFDVSSATPEQKTAFLSADRYSSNEIAARADQAAFHARRARVSGYAGVDAAAREP
jgi:hypothetical protein